MPPNYPKLAYLVNVYPAPSHSFIRREILALEAMGWEIKRFSIRRTESPLHDESDQRESEKTEVLLEAGAVRLVLALLRCCMASPMQFFKAVLMAWRLGRISDVGWIRYMIYLAEACLLCWRLRNLCIGHLHAHFGTNSATVALLCFLLGGPKYSFTVHGPEEFDRATVLGLPEKIHSAAFVVAISQFGRSQLYRWSSYADWSKIHVVHCGLDREYFNAPQTPVPNVPRFICVGRLCEQKGQLLLVDAFAAVAAFVRMRPHLPSAELVLVGDGPMRASIEARIDALEIRDSVRITGWASGETVKREIQDSRALVLPSFAEGLPVVLMEAMALGRPVISTYVAGIPELVLDGVTGWLVPAGDVDALSRTMIAVCSENVKSLHKLGLRGRDRAAARHTAELSAKSLNELFS